MARKVILDTDIGNDIDDSWALGMLLASPELDVKLVVSSVGDTKVNGKMIAKFLEATGHTDVAVGYGVTEKGGTHPMDPWVADYDVSKYPGKVYEDGVQAIVDTIMESDEPVTILAIAPLTNIAAALEREPRIAEKSNIISVMGSIYNGHSLDVIAKASDYNVRADIPAARRVLEAPWDITVVPLDISAHLVIDGDNYQKLLSVRNTNPIVKTIMENFDVWMVAHNATYYTTHSTALYDLGCIYMAIRGDYNLIVEDHKLTIDDGGYTNDDPNGKLCHCAVYWRYVDMFYKFVTDRLCGQI